MKDPETNDLLQSLMKCIVACEHCADACLDEDDPGRLAICIRLDRDCADLCTLAARMIGRGSAHTPEVLQLCIALCKACGQECARHPHDHCRKCAEVCRDCLQRCEAYAALHVEGPTP